jgi:hypothetical protein
MHEHFFSSSNFYFRSNIFTIWFNAGKGIDLLNLLKKIKEYLYAASYHGIWRV